MAAASSSAPGPRPDLLIATRPDPRVLQAVVAALVALDFLICELAGSSYAADLGPLLGLGIVVVATAVTAVIPWERVPPAGLAVLPVLDIAALGLLRLSPHDGGASVVVVVPAVWLARQHGRRGVVLAVAAVALLHSLPRVLYHGADAPVSGAVLLPLVSGIAAWGATVALQALRSRTQEADNRQREVEATMARLTQERDLNEAVLETVDVGLVLLGPDGSYRTLNRQQRWFMQLAFPQGHGGVAGQLGEIFSEDGSRRLTAREEMPSARAMSGEEFEDVRVWVGPDPANRRAVSISARSVRDRNGNLAGAALAYKDITDLLRAVQVKDEFVASVSHELRTPLTSIIGYVDLLLEADGLDALSRRQLAVVHRNGERLLHVVEDLLHTAQLASGHSQLTLETSDLVQLARDAAAAAQPAATAAGVRVEARLPEDVPVLVDPGRIGQVLDNLLSNAVKYNRPGGSVTLALDLVGDTAVLEVRDTGFGMLPREREQLFTRFYRARRASEQAIPGTGLGLSITRAIVEAHDGSIEVDSEVDVGTVLRVRLPLHRTEPAEAAPGTPPGVSAERG